MIRERRLKRHLNIRKKIKGTTERPRVAVYRSSQHIYAQLIDDRSGKTIAFESDLKVIDGTKVEKATKIGEQLAKVALGKKITKVVFDRGGFKFHGRVAALAAGLRKGGLEF